MNSGNQTGESVAVGKSVVTRAEWSLNVWCLFCVLMVHVFDDVRLRKVVDLEWQQHNCNEGSLNVRSPVPYVVHDGPCLLRSSLFGQLLCQFTCIWRGSLLDKYRSRELVLHSTHLLFLHSEIQLHHNSSPSTRCSDQTRLARSATIHARKTSP